MNYGKKLNFGDTIGLIAPSGAMRTEGAIEYAVAETERMGFKVKLGESAGKKYGYLSGTDDIRARDINAMFADDEVDAIFCIRGGYGAMRILDQLDYELIRQHPKIFVGFSDRHVLRKKHRRETLAERFPPMLTKKKKKERRIMKKIFYFKEISVSLLTVR